MSSAPSTAMRHARDPVKLSDFSTDARVVTISAMALVIGILSAFVALTLLKLIGLFTNLFFFQTWGTALVSPAGHRLGVLVVAVPVAGALIIGIKPILRNGGYFYGRDSRGSTFRRTGRRGVVGL